jgi:hypothetical protein
MVKKLIKTIILNNHIFIAITFTVFFKSINLSGQSSLFINKEMLKSYQQNTRSKDGKPGEKYWQNSSDYVINVSFNPKTGTIEGIENIIYYNNSPDTLKKIIVRLYQDLFKKGVSRQYDVDPIDINDGVKIKLLNVNNSELEINNQNNNAYRIGTNLCIPLYKPLLPKSNTKLLIEWSFKVPQKTQIRMGTYDSTSFFIGQWYPQIAVYDDIAGWDTHDYNGLSEFYNDFSNYTVNISVPSGFVVWATGNLKNPEAILNEQTLDKFRKAINSDKTITIATPQDYSNQKIFKNLNVNKWKFEAKNVSDFAFSTSNHYVWEASSVEVDESVKRRVLIQTAYNDTHSDYKEVTEIAKKTILFLSNNSPGIPYPFPCMSIFDGADGMEYPMITNVGSCKERGETIYAQTHEITHSYFPFYAGTNETMYGWMDESLTVLLPEELQTEIEPTKDVPVYTTKVYSHYAGRMSEPVVMTPTNYLTKDIYFFLNYGKAEQILRLLEIQVGKKVFKNCIREFLNRWKYKHPSPYDFFNTFNNISGNDLIWFWKPWYFEQGIPDLSVKNASWENGVCKVTIKNNDALPLPVYLQFTTDDGNIIIHEYSSEIWKEGKDEIVISKNIIKKVTEINIGNKFIPDCNNSDNNFKLK